MKKKLRDNIEIDLEKAPAVAQAVKDFNLNCVDVVDYAILVLEWSLNEKMECRKIASFKGNGEDLRILIIDLLEKTEKLHQP